MDVTDGIRVYNLIMSYDRFTKNELTEDLGKLSIDEDPCRILKIYKDNGLIIEHNSFYTVVGGII